MKIYKVVMGVAWYGENKDQQQADVRAFFAALPSSSKQEPATQEWFVDEADIGAVLVHYASAPHGDPRPKSVEVIMDTLDPAKAVSAMLERVELAALRLENYEERPGFNERANSPISGPHLHSLNRLLLLENCCTDELQSALDAGWRIIAVCPQEARRPDYVLGRCTADEKFGAAARSFD